MAPVLDGIELWGQKIKGRQQQRGMGGYTLCGRCNSQTGKWYGTAYAEWAHQAMDRAQRFGNQLTLSYSFSVQPLPVIKQIISLCMSINNDAWCVEHSDLSRFILNRDLKYLNPRYRLYSYYNLTGNLRTLPESFAKLDLFALLRGETSVIRKFTELTFPPLGYVFTTDGAAPEADLGEISFFTNFDYRDESNVFVSMPVLETHMPIPGDYRTAAEILEDGERDRAAEESQYLPWI